MSKKFKGRTCVYCLRNPSTRSGDHIFAREFFMEDRRGNLPKVPACERCNQEKSQLEHYLTAVLPFGGRHEDASANLRDMVPDRLAGNQRLHRELAQGRENILVEESPAQALPSLAIPFDGAILERLFAFIVKGLAFDHWGVTLTDAHGLRVITITSTGQQAFDLFFGMNAQQHVNVNLGNGTFRYEGKEGDYPELTIWRFSIYGGLVMSGDPRAPQEVATGIGAITAKREFLERPAIAGIFGAA